MTLLACAFGVIVNGWSMFPTISHGDSLCYEPVDSTTTIQREVIVIHQRGFKGTGKTGLALEIKRVQFIAGDTVTISLTPRKGKGAGELVVPEGHLYLKSDARHGFSSRSFGYIPRATIIGIVTRHYSRDTVYTTSGE